MGDKSLANVEKEKGNQFYKNKQFEEALASYDKAVELDPTDMTYLNNKAAVYFEQGKYDECIKQCEKAIEVGRENRADFKLIAKAWARMGNAHQKKEDWQNARTAYQKSLTEHRTPDTLTKLSSVEKIIKDIEYKAYIDPEKANEEKTKGNECYQKGDFPNAIKHYSEAIKRNPEDAKLYSNRAASYMKLAEYSLALKDCEECNRLDPNFVKGYTRKGLCYLTMKQYTQAQSAYQKALEIDENNQEAIEGFKKCVMASASDPEESRKRAMNDPEIQEIVSDPAMRVILQQMQSDPNALKEHLQNPQIQNKIYKLIEAGIISIR